MMNTAILRIFTTLSAIIIFNVSAGATDVQIQATFATAPNAVIMSDLCPKETGDNLTCHDTDDEWCYVDGRPCTDEERQSAIKHIEDADNGTDS